MDKIKRWGGVQNMQMVGKAAISILNCYNKRETENIRLSDKILTGNLQGKTSQKVAMSIIYI